MFVLSQHILVANVNIRNTQLTILWQHISLIIACRLSCPRTKTNTLLYLFLYPISRIHLHELLLLKSSLGYQSINHF